jgi:hypothetical protein
MELKKIKCPGCHRSARLGTLDNVEAIAYVAGEKPDGTLEYEGYTQILWDEQKAQYRGEGKSRQIRMACYQCGHVWWKKCPVVEGSK